MSTTDQCMKPIGYSTLGRKPLLEVLHEAHPGTFQIKSRACTLMWLPNNDKDIEVCHVKLIGLLLLQSLQPWSWPDKPWSQLHLDDAVLWKTNCSYVVVIIEAHSKWLDMFPVSSETSEVTMDKFQILFGIPTFVVNFRFDRAEMKKFWQNSGIHHKHHHHTIQLLIVLWNVPSILLKLHSNV